MDEHMLSTEDNPFNPFEDYKAWDAWDQAAGHHTSAYLARVVITSDDLSEPQQSQAIEDAIDDILDSDVSDVVYIKVKSTEKAA
jgi:hypothetical protein